MCLFPFICIYKKKDLFFLNVLLEYLEVKMLNRMIISVFCVNVGYDLVLRNVKFERTIQIQQYYISA